MSNFTHENCGGILQLMAIPHTPRVQCSKCHAFATLADTEDNHLFPSGADKVANTKAFLAGFSRSPLREV